MNLASIIGGHARLSPAKPAIESVDQAVTYAELDIWARRVVARLRAAGCGTGDLVGLHMRDTPAHLAAFIGILHIGAVALPLDWRSARPELTRVVARFAPKLVITDSRRSFPAAVAMLEAESVASTEPDPNPPARLTRSAMVYNLTSGTTGEPKAMVPTHEEMLGRAMTLAAERIVIAEDRFLSLLPLGYSNGRVIAATTLCLGATALIFPLLFEPRDLMRFVSERRVTAMMASPNVLLKLLGSAARSEPIMPGLRLLVTGGAKLHPEDRARTVARVAPNLVDYYGSTRGGPTSIIANAEDGRMPTSVGRVMLGLEVEIVDDNDAPVLNGTVGAVCLRGPGVVERFVDHSASTDEAIRDGWYYPGDLGMRDGRGLLHLHGRVSDLIKRSGLMVHAQEVEQALLRHEKIADAAVVGSPSAVIGQEVVAFVVVRSKADATEIIHHCRRELASFKVPAQVHFVDALPRNASGKVVKSDLLKLL